MDRNEQNKENNQLKVNNQLREMGKEGEARHWTKPQIPPARWMKEWCHICDKWEIIWEDKRGNKWLMKGVWPRNQ